MIDDVVFFVCNDGFVIEGVILLRCLEEGVWSSPTPVCLPTSSRSRRGVWACMCAYVYVCMCVCVYVCKCVCMCAYVYVCMCVCM